MSARGPLPNPTRRRRNAPVIPTTSLPASGREGDPPDCPYALAAHGLDWWDWAWHTPQACAWSEGDLFAVARRARLEDDVAAMGMAEDLVELHDLLAGADQEAVERVAFALATLKRAAGGKLALEKEMRELDGKLGLTPEAIARLRWKIVADGEQSSAAKPKPAASTVARKPASRGHLRAVDPTAATG